MRKSLPLVLVLLFTPFAADAQTRGKGRQWPRRPPAMRPMMIAPASSRLAYGASAGRSARASQLAPRDARSLGILCSRHDAPGVFAKASCQASECPVKPNFCGCTRLLRMTSACLDWGLTTWIISPPTRMPDGITSREAWCPSWAAAFMFLTPFTWRVGRLRNPPWKAARRKPSNRVQEAAANQWRLPSGRMRIHARRRSRILICVFVRQDGTVFFAVAFTFDSANLRYITRDGFRKTAPLASLDLAATQTGFRRQRGLSPRLPSDGYFRKIPALAGLASPLRRGCGIT